MCELTRKMCDALNEILLCGSEELGRLLEHREAFAEDLMACRCPVVITSVNDPVRGPSPALGSIGLVNCALHLAGCECRVTAVWNGGHLARFELCPPVCSKRSQLSSEHAHFEVMREVVEQAVQED